MFEKFKKEVMSFEVYCLGCMLENERKTFFNFLVELGNCYGKNNLVVIFNLVSEVMCYKDISGNKMMILEIDDYHNEAGLKNCGTSKEDFLRRMEFVLEVFKGEKRIDFV